jgi:hypothetical protein
VLLPSDTHRNPIKSFTAVLLAFVAYLLTLPRKIRSLTPGFVGSLLCSLDLENGCDVAAERRAVPEPGGITTHKIVLFIVSAVRTTNPACNPLKVLGCSQNILIPNDFAVLIA